MVLIDKYGRPITHMRISVTLRCNHRCVFCHREGITGMINRELSSSDWGFVAEVGVSQGIKYYKLTGGEPLIREDIVDIVHEIKNIGGIVSIVTNGFYLAKYASRLSEEKVDHINVSLHSLNDNVFETITNSRLKPVLKGIEEALDYGLKLKLDYVVLIYNVSEFREIIGFAEERGIDVNIIELIPLGLSRSEYMKLHVTLDEIVEWLNERSVRVERKEFQSRPVYVLPSGTRVTVIKGFCNPEMCMNCTRIRMMPDGRIKTCIFRSDKLIDAREHILKRDREGLTKDLEKANMMREPFFKPEKRCLINVYD